MDWSLREGYAWAEDKEHCEEYGRMLTADPSKVSMPYVIRQLMILFFGMLFKIENNVFASS